MASSYRTLNLDVLTVKTILVKSATNSNIPINTVLASDGRGGTSWRNPNILFASSLSTISSITYELTYGLSNMAKLSNIGFGVSSLSSIISYGLSSIVGAPIDNVTNSGVSSLSSIISYGLSSVNAGAQNPGVSSLSSIISYGLSSVSAGAQNPGVSSLSSIISYGLSSVNAGAQNPGVSSLSSIISYGLSSINTTVIGGTYNDTVINNTGLLYFSNVTFSNTTINNTSNTYNDFNASGISSLSSIVSYGLSTVYSPDGISSLSSIVSYGLSSLGAGGGEGVSSLSSIVSYGLSSLGAGGATGISSLSSIVSYGLSSFGGGGISSLSSIVSYGLSSFSLTSVPFNSLIYNTGTNINFTNGTINPSVNTVNGFTVYSCAYGNNVWVIGGAVNNSTPYGLMYSLNGINWNNSSFAISFTMTNTTDYTNNIKYIESNFVATVKYSNNWYFIWSSNGIIWNRNTANITRQVFDYAYNNSSNTWQLVVFPQTGPTKTSILITSNIFVTGGITFTNIVSGGFTTNGCGISYNNNIWVAVGINTSGFSNVQYSINGTNWSNASNVTLRSSSNILRTTSGVGGTSVLYVAPTWFVAGARGITSNPIYRSSNGINYTAIATSNTSNINIVYSIIYDSNSSQFYSLANISNLLGYSGNYLISSANNCSNWSVISPFVYSDAKQIGLAAGVITPPVQTTAVFASNIYANTVNTAYITGDGNGLTNLNVSALSNSLAANIATNTANIATNTANIATNTANIATNATNITDIQDFFTAYTINLNNTTEYTVDQDTRSSNNNTRAGIILSNVFSLSNIGTYRFNMKIKTSVTGNPITARPILYFAPSNYAMENGTNTVVYLTYKAMYQLNPYYNFHTMNDYIVIPSGFTSQSVNVGPHHLWYSEQNSSSSNYELKLTFSDITIQRIA